MQYECFPVPDSEPTILPVRLTKMVVRNTLIANTLRASVESSSGRPDELGRIYDNLIQVGDGLAAQAKELLLFICCCTYDVWAIDANDQRS